MGDYTELRVRATIKHKYRPMINDLVSGYERWDDLALRYTFPWLKSWAMYSRSGTIPFGGSAYFDDDPAWARTFDSETGFLQFQCNLKNYERTIEYFIEHVLPELADEVHECWSQFEYHDAPTRHHVACR